MEKWQKEGGRYENNKILRALFKRLSRVAVALTPEEEISARLETLYGLYEAKESVRAHTQMLKDFAFVSAKMEKRKKFLDDLYALHSLCSSVFMDYNADSFNSMCIRAACGYSAPVLQGLSRSLESFHVAEQSFIAATKAKKEKIAQEDVLDHYTAKAGALLENVDMLAPWCMYKKTAKALDEAGLTFITDALENGSVSGENIIDSFEKNIYKNFLQTNIPLDPALSRFSAAVAEQKSESEGK